MNFWQTFRWQFSYTRFCPIGGNNISINLRTLSAYKCDIYVFKIWSEVQLYYTFSEYNSYFKAFQRCINIIWNLLEECSRCETRCFMMSNSTSSEQTCTPTPPKLEEISCTYFSPKNMTQKKFSAPQMVYEIFERHFKLQWKFHLKKKLLSPKFWFLAIPALNLVKKYPKICFPCKIFCWTPSRCQKKLEKSWKAGKSKKSKKS